ncbi:Cytochrome c-type biogenesis protein CcmF [bacterium HR11]|nr:Cytochrome c-type biogenesis protein CcmF [bacterium HR11]
MHFPWIHYDPSQYPVAFVGTILLAGAWLMALYAMAASVWGGLRRREPWVRSGEHALGATTLVLSMAVFLLWQALYTNNFDLAYIVQHSSSKIPRLYALAALWGGQEGSLLFWVWILSLYTALVLLQNRHRRRLWLPYVSATLALVQLFFLTTILFAANPFTPVPEAVGEGRGLNPILQRPLMAIHPPNLYLGYVGFTVPFAFAVAALVTGRMNLEWLVAVRRWALVPWFFLTAGILIGSRWAYQELGWGGYWAWDPVENASLMPWLLSTAYLHSIMVQEKKNMLRAWNITLIMATFLLSVLGTFITRSGILSSVHAFAVSPIGDYFIVFLSFILFYGLALLYIRWPVIRSAQRIEAVLSKESSFLFNNLLLTGICFAVLWGTLFPLVSDLVKGHRITVAAPFFNQVTAPLGLALLILTGICPLIAWRRATWTNFERNLLLPSVFTLVAASVLFALGLREPLPLAFVGAGVLVLATTALEFYRGVRARRRMYSEPVWTAFGKLFVKHPRRYGGYIVHLGVVLLFFGIVGSAFYQVKREVFLRPGDTAHLQGYTLKYEGLRLQRFPHKDLVTASVVLQRGDRVVTRLAPGREFHPNADQPVTNVAIYSTWRGDVYLVLGAWDENQGATLEMYYNPLVIWFWVGGWLMLVGGVIVMNPRWEPAYMLAPQAAVARP